MKTSSTGRALIRNAEGDKLTAYYCPAGVLTIGVGHTGPDVKPGMRITQAESDALLSADLAKFEKAVMRAVTVPLTQNQFDALVSFTYNLGEGNLRSSTLLKRVNASDFRGAAAEFAKWNKSNGKGLGGLATRRAAEAALFLK